MALPGPKLLAFLNAVLRSGLLNRGQLEESLRAQSPEYRDNPQAVADQLIRSGRLSRFQARKLLEGTGRGLVLGPFQILSPIGRGGMSTVFLARDSRNQRLVALKVLTPKQARQEDRLLARFQREMELSQRLDHRHVCRVYEVGARDGVYYLSLEFVPGKDLNRLVHQEGPLSVARAAHLFAEVAEGLDHAHQRGLIHRDLKPSNIMVTPNDHAKVLDFGLALMPGEQADVEVVGGKGYVVGTMDYIAPEQAADASTADERADLYALGCSLYFALTGRPPFPGGSSIDKIRRHRSEEAEPLTKLAPHVPPAFAQLVTRLMAKRPEMRFPSAAVVKQRLQPWASGALSRPFDAAGDSNFQHAVLALSNQEISEEFAGDILPNNGGVELFPEFAWTSKAEPAFQAIRARGLLHLTNLQLYLLLGALGVVVLLAVGLLILMSGH